MSFLQLLKRLPQPLNLNRALSAHSNFLCLSRFSSQQNNDQPSSENVLQKNKQELKELAKEVFVNIAKYSPKKKYDVFITYSAYELLDQVTYDAIEKDFIRHMNGFTSEQLIKILEGIGKNNFGSQKFQILLEQYFLKHIHNLTVKECVRLCRALVKAFQRQQNEQPSTSKRLCESLHLYFMNKLNDFDSLQKMQMIIALLQMLKSRRVIYIESLELIHERIAPKIAQLTKQELILFGHLFFSQFLENKHQQLVKRERAQDSVNQIMRGSLTSGQSDSEQQQQPPQKLFDSQSSFKEHLAQYQSAILRKSSEFLTADFQVVCDIYKYNKAAIEGPLKKALDDFVAENYLEMTPKEIFMISSLVDLNYVRLYLQNYQADLEYIDLLNFFKTVQMAQNQCYADCLKIVEERVYQIREKWDLDESVYILCAREDQELISPTIQRERFLEELMQSINKELRIQPSNGFKVFYTIWKLLFRSGTQLKSSFVLDLLDNMKLTMRLRSFEEYMKAVEILTFIAENYVEFADPARLVILAIEEKYTLEINTRSGEIGEEARNKETIGIADKKDKNQ